MLTLKPSDLRPASKNRVNFDNGDFLLHTIWLAESAKALVSNIRWKLTSNENAEPYAR